ncbi:hypothetical protein E4U49_007748 [Claviceps purpurea]|nr:hypothetical protein E4U49_007748 [Claviceps purpurea]
MGDLFFFEEYILSRRVPQIRQGKRIDLLVKNSIDLTWLDTGYIPAVIMDSSMGHYREVSRQCTSSIVLFLLEYLPSRGPYHACPALCRFAHSSSGESL